jgi:beta-aspartyl-dipeptidase (metallo-type)
MFTLIENGEVYTPKRKGKPSVLIGAEKIMRVGSISLEDVKPLGVPIDVIDADGCYVVPGFIDPHEHLLGGSGEKGFATQTPEIYPSEIIRGGITTVVGCLGVDTVMKTMAGLLAKAKALKEEGLNAYVWTGGYDMPPASISDSARNDIMFIREVIGLGELAIADERSTSYDIKALAGLVIDAHNGGMLASQSGVTHFHVGESDEGMQMLRDLLDDYPIEPGWIYPTHITRSEKLMKEAIELAKKGTFVDMDTVSEDLAKWVKFYIDHGGPLDQLTISTDSSITSPQNMIGQIRSCVLEEKVVTFEQILPCVTSNTSRVLALGHKGEIAEGRMGDITILDRDELTVRDVISKGKILLRNGKLKLKEAFLEESNRSIRLEGVKA